MTESFANIKTAGWKQLIIPFFATILFAWMLRAESTSMRTAIFILASLPLVFYLLLAHAPALVYLTFLLIPLSVPYQSMAGYTFGFPSEILIAVLCAYFFLSQTLRPFIPREVFRHPLVRLLLAEALWMLVCSFFSNDPLVSMKRVAVRTLFLYLFLIIGTWMFLKKDPRFHWPFLLYGAGLIWPVIHASIFHAAFAFSKGSAYKMTVPFYTDHTIYGAVIVFVLPMLLILMFSNHLFRMRTFAHAGVILLTLFLLTAEILSYSRAAWLSGIVAGVFGLLLMVRVRLSSIIVFLVLAGAATFAYSDQIYEAISKNEAVSNKGNISEHLLSVTNVQSDASNTERINRWMCAWRMAVDQPLTGYGPGMYQFEYGRFQERGHMTRISTFSGNRGHAHSEFFTQLSETGFPGFVLFIAIVLCVIGYGMRVIYNETDPRTQLLLYGAVLGLVTFYVHGIFNAFLDSEKMASLVFGAIAVIVAADIRQRQLR